MTDLKYIGYEHKHLDELLKRLDESIGSYDSWSLGKAEYVQIGLLLKILESLKAIEQKMMEKKVQ